MGNVTKQIQVQGGNQPGTLAKAAACIKEAGVQVTGCSAWNEGGNSTFLFLTENNQKAGEALKKAGYNWKESEVVISTLQHRVGSLAEACKKLGDAGINIERTWVTASGSNALLVLATSNNSKAAGLLP